MKEDTTEETHPRDNLGLKLQLRCSSSKARSAKPEAAKGPSIQSAKKASVKVEMVALRTLKKPDETCRDLRGRRWWSNKTQKPVLRLRFLGTAPREARRGQQ